MNPKPLTSELVELVKVDRAGREYRESMPRLAAQAAIDSIPTAEPDVAFAWIAPLEIDRTAPYPARPVTPQRMWRIASILALYLPFRTAD
jgi:hypothetical protein